MEEDDSLRLTHSRRQKGTGRHDNILGSLWEFDVVVTEQFTDTGGNLFLLETRQEIK